MGTSAEEARYFATPAAFRRWLDRHHGKTTELWVGFHKKGSGTPSITWPESVEEALCFGWIDGLRKTVDETRYRIRFTPRRTGSIWSLGNVRTAKRLIDEGRMAPAGLRAFEARRDDRTGVYSFERRRAAKLPPAMARALRADAAAWADFQARPPWYQRTAIHWVTSAKQESTRARRFAQLLDDSAHGRTIKPLTPPGKSRSG